MKSGEKMERFPLISFTEFFILSFELIAGKKHHFQHLHALKVNERSDYPFQAIKKWKSSYEPIRFSGNIKNRGLRIIPVDYSFIIKIAG